MIHTLPSYEFKRTLWQPKTGVSKSPDSFTLSNTRYNYGGERVDVSITLPRLHRDYEGKQWKAFLTRIKEEEMFYLHDQMQQAPPYLPKNFTPPTLVNTHAGADKRLATTGWSAHTFFDEDKNPRISAGDYLSIISNKNDEPCLFYLEEDIEIDDQGNAIIRVFPGVRTELLAGSQIDFRNPRGLYILDSIPNMTAQQDDFYTEFAFSATQIQ